MRKTMDLKEKRKKLLDFVKKYHGDQKRKYTGDPYWTHPLAVAQRVDSIGPYLFEVGLCHDLLEDTDCDQDMLYVELTNIGYERLVVEDICGLVFELTDRFTKENYPDLSRKERKKKEVLRMSTISSVAQTVKYADLLDNLPSIVRHDPKFAKTYLKEKRHLLEFMNEGDFDLYMDCCYELRKAEKEMARR